MIHVLACRRDGQVEWGQDGRREGGWFEDGLCFAE